ncbi:MAG: hypothetical protein A3A98_04020 [Candidatus Staskawiczbacteria bacterium RIFCSPLOWO2_01_FULL_40_39]|uniref:ComEC/Rec2-related protein domain-containing protein n=1 Tax=Candidatus Staskawiczbacteria bacterium RIFCSPHIGHO2_01_FULL_39_25 TaxID=1802202 RepID=A0A1G2HQF9_9BACT|nr:MAG: hypothetical protein A2730_03235 [Candidatus Staskawiczbacteria bacterium RIFCSPHIGHO2_01_FULL_39_25]OGZ73935.1 MAG: hypothetical protein A3A98_04020 [Candidatus Staskawiczbacteria bacterium RIFCSPLOWO2_01_FULL_40_39]OGZ76531.1 MAG: hypothetical protein A3I87_00225 [Candidatus Staskawiczbacteria bacterium RIFCSPLOWO2_02_FULL_39_8]
MTPSKALFYFCLSFIIGIFFASLIEIPQVISWGFLLTGILMIFTPFVIRVNSSAIRESSLITFNGYHAVVAVERKLIIGFCILFLVVGVARFQIAEFAIANDQLVKLNDTPDNIALTGRIIDAPDIRDTSQKLKIKVDRTKSMVLVTTQRFPEYHYLDEVKLTGKLKKPPEFEDFNYRNYLLKDGIYSIMSFPKIELTSQEHHYTVVTFLYSRILLLKEVFRTSISQNFSPPQSALLEGIMLGNTSGMSREVKDKMSATGLTHLTAISGSNIVILSLILLHVLLFLGFWRGQAFYITVAFIWIYIIMTALPPSGIRAAIMATIFLLGQKLGRQNTNSRVIVIAAALMTVQNPLLLIYDVGFQLSFLALLGIIHLKPITDALFIKVKYKEAKNLLAIVSMTLAAQIYTAPIIMYNFKQISLVAPITNLLVIPAITWIMVTGFIAIVFGIFSTTLGFIFSLPCWILLTYFLKIMDVFYQPWSVIAMQNVSWIWVAFYYLILAWLVWLLHKRQQPKFL